METAVIVSVHGGVITEVLAKGPVTVDVLNYDEAEEGHVIPVPQRIGAPELAQVRQGEQQESPTEVDRILGLLPPEASRPSLPGGVQAIVVFAGGLVQNVVADQALRVVVVDYDVDDPDPSECREIPQSSGRSAWAAVSDRAAEVDRAEVNRLVSLWRVAPASPSPARPRVRR